MGVKRQTMRSLYLLTALFGLVFSFFSCEKEAGNVITYTISNAKKDTVSQLRIVMNFPADTSGITKVRYDDEAWGEENLFNCISGISLRNKKAKLTVERDSGLVIIKHPRDLKEVSLEYTLQQDFVERGERGESYRPLVQEGYFHIFSHNFFMMPEHLGSEGEDILNIVLCWEAFGKDYSIHNSFGHNQKEQRIQNIRLSEFHQAIFVGGDFRTYHEEINGNDIYLASRGEWIPFKDSTVLKVLSRTIELQRNFWSDHSQKYFTVTMRPITQETGSSFQGTGLTNSFATSISNNEHTDIEQLVYLFNHELQHNWIGHTIENDNEEEQYWFSEGFTDYYTIKNIAKHKIQDLDKSYFITELNGTIRNLFASPVREAPNAEINYDNFWSNRYYSKLPYYRGSIFAFYLDQSLRRSSKGKFSLDDIMHHLQEAAVTEGKKITHEYFVDVVNGYFEGGIDAVFQKHIEEGKLLPLATIFDELGFTYQAEARVFDLGFEFNAEQSAIRWVDPNSNAYKAGLRAGDKITSRSIYYDSMTRPVELTFVRGGAETEVSYRAVKLAKIPQLQDTPENRAKIQL